MSWTSGYPSRYCQVVLYFIPFLATIWVKNTPIYRSMVLYLGGPIDTGICPSVVDNWWRGVQNYFCILYLLPLWEESLQKISAPFGFPSKWKGNFNFALGTATCYVNVENYFLTIIKHIAVPSSELEFPLIHNTLFSMNGTVGYIRQHY